VLRTTDHSDTKRLYVLLTQHLCALYSQGIAASCASPHGHLPSYEAFRKTCEQNTQVTVGEMWARMLCSAPSAPHLCVVQWGLWKDILRGPSRHVHP
jgi:hypothetical protein